MYSRPHRNSFSYQNREFSSLIYRSLIVQIFYYFYLFIYCRNDSSLATAMQKYCTITFLKIEANSSNSYNYTSELKKHAISYSIFISLLTLPILFQTKQLFVSDEKTY